MKMRHLAIIVVAAALVVGGVSYLLLKRDPSTGTQKPAATAPVAAPVQTGTKEQAPKAFDKTAFSVNEPSSIWVVVNKERPLPKGYKPSDLQRPNIPVNSAKTAEENTLSAQATAGLEALVADAKKQGYNLFLGSGYRSEAIQQVYFNNFVQRDGYEAARKYSALPGTSEHQTGFSLDIARSDRKCYLEICFGETSEGKWIAENAHTYGYIVRYQKGKEASTGYQYEPWHIRYVGTELAAELKKSGQSMEEFFGL